MSIIHCPHCRGPLQNDGSIQGEVACPHCRGRFALTKSATTGKGAARSEKPAILGLICLAILSAAVTACLGVIVYRQVDPDRRAVMGWLAHNEGPEAKILQWYGTKTEGSKRYVRAKCQRHFLGSLMACDMLFETSGDEAVFETGGRAPDAMVEWRWQRIGKR